MCYGYNSQKKDFILKIVILGLYVLLNSLAIIGLFFLNTLDIGQKIGVEIALSMLFFPIICLGIYCFISDEYI